MIDYKDIKDNYYYRDIPNNGAFRVEWVNGDISYHIDGDVSRLDGPARIDADGTKWWIIDGGLHRLDGPAVEYSDGKKEWAINDECMSRKEWLRERETWLERQKTQEIKELVI